MASKRKLSFIDHTLEKLPQIHLYGYRYCGPNTNLTHVVPGVNKLDCACMEHDVAYAESTNLNLRCIADKLLILRAIRRIYASDSQVGERFAALLVSLLISIKLGLSKIEIYICKLQKCLSVKFNR